MRIPFPHNFPAELRLVEEADAEKLFGLIDRNRQHLRRWLPWIDSNMTINDTQHSSAILKNSIPVKGDFRRPFGRRMKLPESSAIIQSIGKTEPS